MTENYAGLNPETTFLNNDINFCSIALLSTDALVSGTASVVAWFDNSNGSACNVTATLRKNSGTTVGTATVAIPAVSGVASYTWSIAVAATTFAAGNRLNLELAWPISGSKCKNTTLHYSGTTYRSRLDAPFAGLAAPNPPTGLSATTNSDGTVTLRWTVPSGTSPSFYRIYRDGHDYTQRYDTTGAGTDNSYIDTNTGGTVHNYYVTAVNGSLAESAALGPVHP